MAGLMVHRPGMVENCSEMKLLAGHFEDGASPSAGVGAEFDGGFVKALEIQFGRGERVVQDIERSGAICFHVGEAMKGRASAIEGCDQRGGVFDARAGVRE